jgi:hypothetical protein
LNSGLAGPGSQQPGRCPAEADLQHGLIGPAEHIGLIVPDLDEAMRTFRQAGFRWSAVSRPNAVLRSGGRTETTALRYVVTAGSLPRLKLIEEVPGTYWCQDRPGIPFHHLSHWADDIEETTALLLADGSYSIDADGLEADGSLRYRYLVSSFGARIELGLRRNRDEFEHWAEGRDGPV